MKGKFCSENGWAREGFFGKNEAILAILRRLPGPRAGPPYPPAGLGPPGGRIFGQKDERNPHRTSTGLPFLVGAEYCQRPTAVAAAQPKSGFVADITRGSWACPAWSTMKSTTASARTLAFLAEAGTTGLGVKRPFSGASRPRKSPRMGHGVFFRDLQEPLGRVVGMKPELQLLRLVKGSSSSPSSILFTRGAGGALNWRNASGAGVDCRYTISTPRA